MSTPKAKALFKEAVDVLHRISRLVDEEFRIYPQPDYVTFDLAAKCQDIVYGMFRELGTVQGFLSASQAGRSGPASKFSTASCKHFPSPVRKPSPAAHQTASATAQAPNRVRPSRQRSDGKRKGKGK